MQTSQTTFPVHVRTRWLDFSPAFHWHTTRKIESALHPFAPQISSVTVRITDLESDLGSRRCAIQIMTKPAGFVSASAVGIGRYESADRAIERGRALLECQLAGKGHDRVLGRAA